jgi:hypothetical protein
VTRSEGEDRSRVGLGMMVSKGLTWSGMGMLWALFIVSEGLSCMSEVRQALLTRLEGLEG